MARKLKDLPIGTKIKDLQTTYYGKPITWIIVDKNHSGYPSNTVTLIAEKILCLKCVDAKEPKNTQEYRKISGNNNYKLSNIHKWLNSIGEWYVPQHAADGEPIPENVYQGYNPYATEHGFLTAFSQKFLNEIQETTIEVSIPKEDGGGFENIKAKLFLASRTELGFSAANNSEEEGSKIAFFSDGSSRGAYPTAEAVSRSNYVNEKALSTNIKYEYWTRTHYKNRVQVTFKVVPTAIEYSSFAVNDGKTGIRPLCNIKDEIVVEDHPDSSGTYLIEWNQSPTNPSSITVPSNIKANSSAYIYWGTSTDPEETSVGYELERRIDSGPWTRIYRGITKNYTDTIGTGWSTVTYRVRAYDIENKYSGYTTSPTRNVINNTSPSIASQQQENIGLKTQEFSISYTITDPDLNQTLTVREYIDKKEKRSYTASSGKSYTFQVTREEWIEILNGTHTLKITVSDSAGGYTEKVFTFSKNETEIAFQLKNPLPADDKITKATANIVGVIPEAAILRVEVCNNAFDSAPTWEDVTQQVKQNAKFFLTNKTKTDKRWGFNIRVRVQRNQTYGECYISSIGGNFE